MLAGVGIKASKIMASEVKPGKSRVYYAGGYAQLVRLPSSGDVMSIIARPTSRPGPPWICPGEK